MEVVLVFCHFIAAGHGENTWYPRKRVTTANNITCASCLFAPSPQGMENYSDVHILGAIFLVPSLKRRAQQLENVDGNRQHGLMIVSASLTLPAASLERQSVELIPTTASFM